MTDAKICFEKSARKRALSQSYPESLQNGILSKFNSRVRLSRKVTEILRLFGKLDR